MKSTVIQNCWRHTGLLSSVEAATESQAAGTEIVIEEDDVELRENYDCFVVRANIKEAMTIDNFLNLVEEEKVLADMEMLDIEEYLLQTIDINGNVESESEVEVEPEKPLYSDLSQKEQITALAIAIAVCERRDNISSKKVTSLMQGLREVQRKIRREKEQAEEEKLVQRRITHYF